ncbi:hypothetical protein DB32_002137 [Sandaracinus amylolyticus]|uniref:Uncharacterized protein n=1 Tax=Sandaracinus amylolyticus TaxID=927083 RepID=A0A0F6YID3_9BACT|nr:hypothetical protein DB32_002137 [Sandaracinus amylolyticus]
MPAEHRIRIAAGSRGTPCAKTLHFPVTACAFVQARRAEALLTPSEAAILLRVRSGFSGADTPQSTADGPPQPRNGAKSRRNFTVSANGRRKAPGGSCRDVRGGARGSSAGCARLVSTLPGRARRSRDDRRIDEPARAPPRHGTPRRERGHSLPQPGGAGICRGGRRPVNSTQCFSKIVFALSLEVLSD